MPGDSWSIWCFLTGHYQRAHTTKFLSAPGTPAVLGARIYFRLRDGPFAFFAIFLNIFPEFLGNPLRGCVAGIFPKFSKRLF